MEPSERPTPPSGSGPAPTPHPHQPTGPPGATPLRVASATTPVGEQLENAYDRIGITGSHRFIMGMILLGVFFDAIEQNAVGITGPVVREYWGLHTGEVGLLNTMTFTATALGRIIMGIIADKYGRRRMLVINLLIFAFGSLLCALAPSYGVLLGARFIVGFGLGGEIAVAVVMASEYFSARHRGTAVGLINVTAAGFGNMLAPAFGIAVYAIFDGPERWRWVFGLLFLPALLVIYFRRYVPEMPRYLAKRGEIERANEALTLLQRGHLKGRLEQVEPFLVVDATTPGFTAEVRGAWYDPLRDIYAKRTFLLIVAVACSYAAQISMLTLMPTILVDSGHKVSSSLWYTLVMQSGSLVGAATAAYLASRWARKRTLTIAAVIGLTAGLSLAFLPHTLGIIIAFGWLFNFAVIILNTTIWLFAPENYPTRIRGFGTSIILAAGSLSGGLFPLVAGMLFDVGGLAAMFATLAVLFAILGVTVQFLAEKLGGRWRRKTLNRADEPTVLLVNPNTNTATTRMMADYPRTCLPDMRIVELTVAEGPPMIIDPDALRASAEHVVSAIRGYVADHDAEQIKAVVVGAIGDPGRAELASELSVPVIGIGEASITAAAGGGRPFGMATSTPNLVESLTELVRSCGHTEHFCGVTFTPSPPLVLAADPERQFTELDDAVRRSVESGAEAVIIAGGPLSDTARLIAESSSAHIVEPIPSAAQAIRAALQTGTSSTPA